MKTEISVKTGDILGIDNFDPMGLDITYIQSTIREIPEDGLIDINNAERLATIFLRCADYTADKLAQTIRYWGVKGTQQKAAKSEAIYKKIGKGVTPTVAKEAFANEETFIAASNEATTAEALVKWLEEKYANLVRAHILCKNILARHMSTERANSWQGNESAEDYTPVSSVPTPSRTPASRPNFNSGPMKAGFIDL